MLLVFFLEVNKFDIAELCLDRLNHTFARCFSKAVQLLKYVICSLPIKLTAAACFLIGTTL